MHALDVVFDSCSDRAALIIKTSKTMPHLEPPTEVDCNPTWTKTKAKVVKKSWNEFERVYFMVTVTRIFNIGTKVILLLNTITYSLVIKQIRNRFTAIYLNDE